MTRFILVPLSALAMLAGCAPQQSPEAAAADAAQDASKLDQVLAGRTAGAPMSCVNQTQLGGNRSYGEDVIVFNGPTSSVVYVNRPAGGCPEITSSRALRTRTTSTQLCRNDIATVFDPVSGIEYGSCGLGDFVPYRK